MKSYHLESELQPDNKRFQITVFNDDENPVISKIKFTKCNHLYFVQAVFVNRTNEILEQFTSAITNLGQVQNLL